MQAPPLEGQEAAAAPRPAAAAAACLLQPLFGGRQAAVSLPLHAPGGQLDNKQPPAVVLGRRPECSISDQALQGLGAQVSRRHATVRTLPAAPAGLAPAGSAEPPPSGVSPLPVAELQLHEHAVYLERWQPQGQHYTPAERLPAGSSAHLHLLDRLYLLRANGHLLFGFQVIPTLQEAQPGEAEKVAQAAGAAQPEVAAQMAPAPVLPQTDSVVQQPQQPQQRSDSGPAQPLAGSHGKTERADVGGAMQGSSPAAAEARQAGKRAAPHPATPPEQQEEEEEGVGHPPPPEVNFNEVGIQLCSSEAHTPRGEKAHTP